MHALADPATTPDVARKSVPWIFYGQTTSLCETCWELVPAKIIGQDGKVFYQKRCPDHGVTKTLTTHYTVTDGLVTFTGGNIPTGGSPAQTITASGNPYVRVRFADDYNPVSLPISPDIATPFASAGPFVLMEVLA